MIIKRNPWHLWLFSFFVLFLYSMGIYDLFMMLSHNQNYYVSHGYGLQVTDYFTNYPIYFLVLWVTNLLGGFFSPLLLIIRSKWAKTLALTSTVADILLLLFTFIFRNRFNVLGVSVAVFDIFILGITFGWYLYCRYIDKHMTGV